MYTITEYQMQQLLNDSKIQRTDVLEEIKTQPIVDNNHLKVEWEKTNPEYGPTFYKGIVGEWVICSIHPSQIHRGFYDLNINLPGIKSNELHASIVIAKTKADVIFQYWVKKLYKK
jgi:hypothetical protein